MPKNVLFFIFTAMTVLFFQAPLRELMGLTFKSELYSHILLIPAVSAYFFYTRRKSVFEGASPSAPLGLTILSGAIILYLVGTGQGTRLSPNDYLAVRVFAAVTVWIGGFVLFYGVTCFRKAAFPLLFLFFLTPIPTAILDAFILVLQVASTEVTHFFFELTGVPVLRDRFTFHLPNLSIEVAKQCSGIRSSIALVITSIIAGQLFLRAGWRRVVLILAIFPITVFKNGLRIAGLTLFGAYVDPRILDSEAHRSGGIPFFFVALLLMAPVLYALIRSEKKGQRAKD